MAKISVSIVVRVENSIGDATEYREEVGGCSTGGNPKYYARDTAAGLAKATTHIIAAVRTRFGDL